MRTSGLLLVFTALLLSACGTGETTNRQAGSNRTDVAPVVETTQNESSAAQSTTTQSPVLTKVANTTVATAAQEEEWGTIKGRIVVTGDVPEPEAIDPGGKDADFCGADADMMTDTVVVGEDGGLKNASLFLYMSRREVQEPKIHPSYEEEAEGEVTIDNVNCMFEPHVAFLRTSQTLVAKNSDPKGHNVQNTSRVNAFNPLIAPKGEVKLEMQGPERLPTKLACNIHPWMTGYMIVRDEPYVAITDEDGSFEIKNMPEGEWKFQFWHETTGYMVDLQAEGKPVMEGRPATVTISVKNGEETDLGELTIAGESLSAE